MPKCTCSINNLWPIVITERVTCVNSTNYICVMCNVTVCDYNLCVHKMVFYNGYLWHVLCTNVVMCMMVCLITSCLFVNWNGCFNDYTWRISYTTKYCITIRLNGFQQRLHMLCFMYNGLMRYMCLCNKWFSLQSML